MKDGDKAGLSDRLSPGVILLFAVAGGLSVANIYYAQPLLEVMARELSISPASIGIVVTVTQIGYALGLIFIVPLGDLLERRRLIVGQAILSSVALIIVSQAPTATVLLVGMVAVGLLAVVVQVLVAFAASLAAPAERGRVVGSVTSGIVIGILLARFVSGVLADLGGWRSVYLASAMLTLLMAALLSRTLPRQEQGSEVPSYPALLRSMLVLFIEEPVLRIRAVIGLLIFATFSTFWTSIVLPLSAPPLLLSHTEVGLLGLAGVAGALAAGGAGRMADQGQGQRTTGISLSLMLVAWIPIVLTRVSLWALIVGVIVLDLAIQAVHVTNQSMIFAVRPEARSRLVAGYMVFYSLGSASGSIASTLVYSWAGWTGVCVLGAAISTLALLFWATTRHVTGAAHSTRHVNSSERGASSRTSEQLVASPSRQAR
ncbi:MFS transporter [Archangium minus]|uniref:MFS transporter n=1 Tax=Archangium minus TaxID=83450 RepID=A0ABY9WQ27_9BACT|nr:MFS transporter [Archangium minus]